MKKELLLNTEVQPAIIPQNNDGTVVAGTIFDRANFLSAIVAAQIGAVTGTPTGLAATVTVYSGDTVDSETTPTSITDEVASTTYVLSFTGAQAGSVDDFMNVDLTGLGRWVRVAVDLTFTAGTTPKADIAAQWVFGDPRYSENVTDAANV